MALERNSDEINVEANAGQSQYTIWPKKLQYDYFLVINNRSGIDIRSQKGSRLQLQLESPGELF